MKNADSNYFGIEGPWQWWHLLLIGLVILIIFVIFCLIVKSWVKTWCFNPQTGKVGINPFSTWTYSCGGGGGGGFGGRNGGFGGGGDFGGGGGGGDGGGC